MQMKKESAKKIEHLAATNQLEPVGGKALQLSSSTVHCVKLNV